MKSRIMTRLQKKSFAFYYHTESRTKLLANIFILFLIVVASINSILDRGVLALVCALIVAAVWYYGSTRTKAWRALYTFWKTYNGKCPICNANMIDLNSDVRRCFRCKKCWTNANIEIKEPHIYKF